MLTDRELATLIWFGLVALACVAVPRWRRHLRQPTTQLVRAFFAPQLLRIFALFLAWIAAWVALAYFVGAWDSGLLKDTVIIVATVGFPLLLQMHKTDSGLDILGRIRRETIALSVLLLFYLNLVAFPLWAELITQPLVVIVSAMLVLAQHRENTKPAAGCLGVVLGVGVIALIIWTSVEILTSLEDLDVGESLNQLALSIWLPFVLFPFLYVAAFYMECQTILVRVGIVNQGMHRRAKLGIIVGLRFSVRWANAFTGRYNWVGRESNLRGTLTAMARFREDVERRESLEAQRQRNLIEFAGETGVDGTGAQLDRREFHGTKGALDFIHTAQALRYERLGERFWDDLTDMVLSPASRFGLPDDHGLTVETTPDRRRWRAWRRLPNGWVLGVGATGRFGEYRYSGPGTPASWPGDEDEWVDTSRSMGPVDWDRDDSPIT